MSPRDLGLVLLSALLHAAWNVSTKGSRDPLAFAVVFRGVALAAFLLLLPWLRLGEVPVPVWRFLVGSVVFHGFYFYWLTRSYQVGDLSLVYPISRSTPAFIPLLAIPLLGERISPAGGCGIAVVVGGIWLAHAEGWRWRSFADPGFRLALLALATTVGYSLLDKQAMAAFAAVSWDGPLPRAIVYYFLIEILSSVLFLPLAWRRLDGRVLREVARSELGVAARAQLVAFVSYALILEALRTASVSYVVAVRQASVLFALAFGMVLLRDRPSRLRLLGALATVAGVVLVSLG